MYQKKLIYFSLLILVIIFISITCFSYAFFTHQIEEHGKLNIVAGTLDYQIESKDLENNQILVEPNRIYELEIEIDSFNTIDSKYELYYLLDQEVDGFEIGYFEVTEDLPKGEISTNGRKKIKIGIQNLSTKTITVTFGVEGGFINQNLVLKKGKSLTLLDYCRVGETKNFTYIGDSQTFTTQCSGTYKVELWGAQGGSIDTYIGGKGAYTSGNIKLNINTSLYVYVGEQGNDNQTVTYNGGTVTGNINAGKGGMAGGGATDVRLVSGSWARFDSLKSRIMVASSGSGATNYYHPDHGVAGGELIGENGKVYGGDGIIPTGGTQTSGGIRGGGSNSTYSTSGSFGKGGQGGGVNSGGSGYYGGGAAPHGTGTVGVGGSGSSFISGYPGCDAISEESTEDHIIHTDQPNHYSGFIFTDSIMIAGNKEMPTYDGSQTMIGNTGNGYAKITYLGN